MFAGYYQNRRVLVTGHTGFKGAWLSLWLAKLGAKVTGIALPAPTEQHSGDEFCAALVGIGGTGVVTVNQILGTAATIAGLHAQTYDHTGSSQKAGPVVSHLKISRRALESAPTVSGGGADLYLVFDALGAVAPANIASCRAVERAGMHCAGEEIEPDGRSMLVYAIEAPTSQPLWRSTPH